MNIGLFAYAVPQSASIPIKGMDSYIYNLGRELMVRNTVNIYVRDPVHRKEPWIHTVRTRGTWFLYPHFLEGKIKDVSADVYHAEYIATGSALMHAKKTPTVVSVHDVIPFSDRAEGLKQNRLKNKIGSWFYFRWFNAIKNADALILMSHHAKEEAIALIDVPEDRLHVVYNGVDLKRFYPMPKKEKDTVTIGYLGGLDGRKNVELLIQTFQHLQKSHDTIELRIAGKGKNLNCFRSMNIPHAHFLGFIPDSEVNAFYNSLDIFVFPSLKEGFGNMALEAMAAGTPTVVANRTSLPEVVGNAGVVAEPTVESMAEALSPLISTASLRKKLSVAGRERAESMGWDACAKNTEKVYQHVVG